MGEEAVPVIRLRDRVPGPVRHLGVLEDDAHAAVPVVAVAPDVVVALRARRGTSARCLEPGVLVGGVVDDQLGDDLEPARVGGRQEGSELVERAVVGMDVEVVRDVVAVVAQRRRVHRQQPDAIDAQLLQVIEPGQEPREVTHAVRVGVGIGLDVQLVEDRVLEPERVVGHRTSVAPRRAPRASCDHDRGYFAVKLIAVVECGNAAGAALHPRAGGGLGALDLGRFRGRQPDDASLVRERHAAARRARGQRSARDAGLALGREPAGGTRARHSSS